MIGQAHVQYGSGPTNLYFWPREFQCKYAGRVHDNVATSGVKERVVENLDMLVTFTLPAMQVGVDYGDIAALMQFMLGGGEIAFNPQKEQAGWFHCKSEGTDWAPTRVGPGRYSASFVWRITPDSQAPADPGAVMEMFYGV